MRDTSQLLKSHLGTELWSILQILILILIIFLIGWFVYKRKRFNHKKD